MPISYKLRKSIYKRDNYQCYICGCAVKRGIEKKRDGFPLATLDHVIPRSLGGPDTKENLKTCCKVCNENKGCGEIDKKKEIRIKLPPLFYF